MSMREILDLVEFFQTRGQKVMRYKKNPFVEGDSVVEHLARVARLLVYISPDLQKEFPDQTTLIQEIFMCLIIHDDEEIIDGFDESTVTKVHDADNDSEIKKFSSNISTLSTHTQEVLVDAFSSFRYKSSLPAKIAKAIDNITGNQLVIEQKVGLINPDSARFCIEYAQKVTGTSKVIDTLVQAQIQQVLEGREKLKADKQEILRISEASGLSGTSKIEELLGVDVMTHVLDKNKVYTPIAEL